jgi:hypothetical protein
MGQPIVPALALVQFVRSLRGVDDEGCPEVRNAAGNSYAVQWTPPGPSARELSAWYDAAHENIARAETHGYTAQVGATKRAAQLRQLYDALPNRVWAQATDPQRYVKAAADLAQAALCIVHEANAAATRRPGEPPTPAEEEGEPWWRRVWEKLPSLPDVGSWDWPELPTLPSLTIPPWAFLVAGGVLVLMLSRRGRRDRSR